ncbi:MAG TPA: Franean1_4349 family RiPP [Polyangiaceae bacterium]|jgi:hypothetical protein|nr:Franean1_4349 family RiPP [Polyangiaceae bacterium]
MSKTLNELIGRAVTDPDFRMRLFNDPERTLADDGYELSPEVIEKLKSLDIEAAEAAVNQLDEAFAGRSAAG